FHLQRPVLLREGCIRGAACDGPHRRRADRHAARRDRSAAGQASRGRRGRVPLAGAAVERDGGETGGGGWWWWERPGQWLGQWPRRPARLGDGSRRGGQV